MANNLYDTGAPKRIIVEHEDYAGDGEPRRSGGFDPIAAREAGERACFGHLHLRPLWTKQPPRRPWR